MRSWSCAIGMLLLSIAGCDLPPARPTTGPAVVRIVPDPGGEPVDRLVTFRIELDRRVAPASLVQGVVEVRSGDNYVFVDMAIDAVHPAILVTPSDALDPEATYTMQVHALRDLDGHLSGDTTPVRFATSTQVTRAPPDAITFDDVAPTFAACASADCHVGAAAPEGLDLSSAAAIRATALGIAAREVAPSTGPYMNVGVTAGLLGMSRIDPRGPGTSYLLYTMLADEHIAGAPMPPSGEPPSDAELDRMQRWIQAGAPGI